MTIMNHGMMALDGGTGQTITVQKSMPWGMEKAKAKEKSVVDMVVAIAKAMAREATKVKAMAREAMVDLVAPLVREATKVKAKARGRIRAAGVQTSNEIQQA